MTIRARILAAALTGSLCALTPNVAQAQWPDIREAKAIAEEGFIYGLAIVMNYAVMNEYAVNKNSGQFKAPFNQIKNEARVFTYQDTSIITPNSDTPYSFMWMDLRAEPMVLSVPAVDKSRTDWLAPQCRWRPALPFSLLTGNFTGKISKSGNWVRQRRQFVSQIEPLLAQFPKSNNRE